MVLRLFFLLANGVKAIPLSSKNGTYCVGYSG